MEASLSAVAAQAALGAVVSLDAATGRAGAAAADATPAEGRGPFHGVPFLVKDLGGAARGLCAAAGSAALRRRGAVPNVDSDLIAAVRQAGCIPFGLTATPPFGLSLTSQPEGLPPARNPWSLDLTPGGSSGGASAAVAAGIVALAHATDAAGSIRVPAACCGLTGLKPSRGAVPGGPDYDNHLMGIVSEFVLARSVRDVAAAYVSVCRAVPAPRMPETPRIGVALPDRCGADQTRASVAAAEALCDAGCAVKECAAPDALGAEAHDLARTILAVSLADWLLSLEVPFDEVPPLAAALATEGRACPATTLFAATRGAARLADEAAQLFAACDVLVMPVLSKAPLPAEALDLTSPDTVAHFGRMEAFAPNAALANIAGLPALALPFGLADGLPVGVQLVGPIGCDLVLLRLGQMIEDRAPPLTFPGQLAGLPA